MALEYKTETPSSYFLQKIRDKLIRFFLNAGILIRPLGNVLYLLPPYCLSSSELDYIFAKIIDTLEKDTMKPSFEQRLKNILPHLIAAPSLHAKWLNTLSYLENCGARKIAACEHPTL